VLQGILAGARSALGARRSALGHWRFADSPDFPKLYQLELW
jgi:hypothetical protein